MPVPDIDWPAVHAGALGILREYLRIDTVQMDDVLGLRLNVWTSIVLFALAAAFYLWSSRRHPGREDVVRTKEPDDELETAGPTA